MKHYLSYIEEAIKENWNKPAISNYGENTLNYSDIAINISKLHILFEKCGIKKGDHIAICAKSSAEWCVAFLAIASYEAVAVPLLSDFIPENVINLTVASDSKLLFVDKGVLAGMKRDKVLEKFTAADKLIALVDIVTWNAVEGYEEKLNVGQSDIEKIYNERFPNGMSVCDVDLNKGDNDSLAVISYTSGTSSSPKGVMLSARSLSGNLEIARKLVPVAVNEGGSTLSILPFAHIFGLAFDFLFLFSCGCHINIFTEKPVPARLLKALSVVKPWDFKGVF